MEEDTIEIRMAKIASEFEQLAKMARERANSEQAEADLYERCASRLRVALQEAPPPTDRPT